MKCEAKKILALAVIFFILGFTVVYICYSIGKKLEEKVALNTAQQKSKQEKNNKVSELEVLKSLSVPEEKVKTETEKNAEVETLKSLSAPVKKSGSNEASAEQTKKDLEILRSLSAK